MIFKKVLQTAMISRFSENGEAYRKMMNTITGGFVYGIVIVIAKEGGKY